MRPIHRPINYRTPMGNLAQARCFEEKADLPIFDIEVVREGEVIEYIPRISGYTALTELARRRNWVEE